MGCFSVASFTCFGTSVARDRADILTLLFLLKEKMSFCNSCCCAGTFPVDAQEEAERKHTSGKEFALLHFP